MYIRFAFASALHSGSIYKKVLLWFLKIFTLKTGVARLKSKVNKGVGAYLAVHLNNNNNGNNNEGGVHSLSPRRETFPKNSVEFGSTSAAVTSFLMCVVVVVAVVVVYGWFGEQEARCKL